MCPFTEFVFVFVCFLVIVVKQGFCVGQGCLGTHGDALTVALQMLGLKVCATTPAWGLAFCFFVYLLVCLFETGFLCEALTILSYPCRPGWL